MAIWRGTIPALPHVHAPDSLSGHLGMELTELGEDFLKGSMPVDRRTMQNQGLLHGGASVALAETLMSVAASLTLDRERYYVVGQEINANHVRSVRQGRVTGTARPAHLGRASQVWTCEIRDEQDRLICISRMTVAVLPREPRRNP
jgi:1,4-dihydroxy-2-naphthoyl-CoA hydrolase